MTNFYNMGVIKENYIDFVSFILSQPASRHVSVDTHLDEIADYINDRGTDPKSIYDYMLNPIGIFGYVVDDEGAYHPMSQYGSEYLGAWCCITSQLDEYNYLCYGHLQKFIKDNELYELKPCKY